MTRYIPPSIQSEGLESFLNSKKELHNGFGYTEFCTMHAANVNPGNLARAFNVTRPTIIKWLTIYKSERARH